jgi:hypothetical protein
LRVVELENALCNQDKLLCKIFRENKKLNLKLKSASSEIASLRSAHYDMSVKPCDKCNMIMVNYADLWLVHSHIASLLDDARLELRELKAHSTLLGACTSSEKQPLKTTRQKAAFREAKARTNRPLEALINFENITIHYRCNGMDGPKIVTSSMIPFIIYRKREIL